MPIEIKELHIHVAVNASPSGQPSAGHQGEAGGGGDQSNDNEAIVAECVEQVLQILQNKMER